VRNACLGSGLGSGLCRLHNTPPNEMQSVTDSFTLCSGPRANTENREELHSALEQRENNRRHRVVGGCSSSFRPRSGTRSHACPALRICDIRTCTTHPRTTKLPTCTNPYPGEDRHPGLCAYGSDASMLLQFSRRSQSSPAHVISFR